MLNLKNDVDSLDELFKAKEHVVLYGAGSSARLLLQSCHEMFPEKSLEYIIDANESLDETYCAINESVKVRVISLRHFCKMHGEHAKKFTFLLTPYFSLFVINTLDQVKELDQAEVYVHSFILEKTPPFKFRLRATDSPRIPRTIHYFWIGGSALPDEYKKNIESWRKYCPGYEIVEWNESNYDFRKHRYMREALENKQYMYATDVARKDVLYEHGGIYFDADVELIRPIDDLLYNEAFIGIDDGGQVNSGAGLGAARHNEMIRDMLELYGEQSFVREDGSFNSSFNTFYETQLLIRRGFKIGNQYQTIGTMNCLPREVLNPEGIIGLRDNYTENTKANHKIDPYDKSVYAPIRRRLYGDS